MGIDTVEICFGIANWQISSIFGSFFLQYDSGGVLSSHILIFRENKLYVPNIIHMKYQALFSRENEIFLECLLLQFWVVLKRYIWLSES